jgi:hypothetical protein
MKKRSGIASAVAAVTAGLVVIPLSTAAQAGTAPRPADLPAVTVVASGLDNPRHLAFGPGGLYVAEAGTGGSSCVTISGDSLCEGETGAVALVTRFGAVTVLSGLPSVLTSGEGAAGPSSMTFDHGRLAVLLQDAGVNPDGTTAVQGPGSDLLGKLLLAWPFSGPSRWFVRANLAAFAAANPQNPATLGGPPGAESTYDSDPYDIVRYRHGYAIADAAANDVLWLSPAGRLSVLTRLPTVPTPFSGTTIDAQAVPTSLAVGPDGALYIGTLPGFPGLPGTSRVYRLVPGQAPTIAVNGLTMVTSIAFDHEGRLLALEYNTGGLLAPPTTPGALVQVDLATGAISTVPVSGLSAPAGLAVGAGGAVYVANDSNSTTSGTGQVLKITGLG